jgi:hypothetical protein
MGRVSASVRLERLYRWTIAAFVVGTVLAMGGSLYVALHFIIKFW